MSPLLPWSAHPTYTVELLFGSTAMESVDPTRSCPKVGAFDQGIDARLTTIRPSTLSDGSFKAWNGLRPVPPLASRTTKTQLVATEPLNFRHHKKATYRLLSPAMAVRTERPT